MKTFDEAFRAVVISKGNPAEFMESDEFAVNVASQKELADELRDDPTLDFYFQAVYQSVVRCAESHAHVLPNLMFTVFIAGIRVGQEMEKP